MDDIPSEERGAGRARHWLVKSEPAAYAFADLMKAPDRTTSWEGVRNYQARNFMRDEMTPGDPVLVYHSSTAHPAVVGLAEVARAAYPDPSQFDPASPFFDAKASAESPRWAAVDLRGLRALERPVTLEELKRESALEGLALLRRGNRLSVMPLSAAAFTTILALARRA